jgi:hypothetical protein
LMVIIITIDPFAIHCSLWCVCSDWSLIHMKWRKHKNKHNLALFSMITYINQKNFSQGLRINWMNNPILL